MQSATAETTEARVRGPRVPADKATPQTIIAETASANDVRQKNEHQKVTIKITPSTNSVEPAPASDATPHRTSSPFLFLAGNREMQTTTSPGEQVLQARFLQLVSKAFQVAHERGGPIRLRLHPPELDSLHLEVKVEGNVVVARIETETTTTRALLLDSLSVLRDGSRNRIFVSTSSMSISSTISRVVQPTNTAIPLPTTKLSRLRMRCRTRKVMKQLKRKRLSKKDIDRATATWMS